MDSRGVGGEGFAAQQRYNVVAKVAERRHRSTEWKQFQELRARERNTSKFMRNECTRRERRRRCRRRCPPEQLERVRRRLPRRRRRRRRSQRTDASAGCPGQDRGCDSISLGTVILQRLLKLKRLDCFQRARLVGPTTRFSCIASGWWAGRSVGRSVERSTVPYVRVSRTVARCTVLLRQKVRAFNFRVSVEGRQTSVSRTFR